jgi:hypothetical protein
MPCSRQDVCGLARSIPSHVALLLWQRAYCETEGGFETCRRYELAQLGEPVPEGMLPSGFVLGYT